jgi:hypothetical protein
VSQRRLKLSQARSRSGVQVTSGTRVGGITGTGEVATITGGDLDLTPILTRIGGRGGGVAGPMTTVGSLTTVASVGPVTTVASAGPVTTVGLMGPVVADSSAQVTVRAGTQLGTRLPISGQRTRRIEKRWGADCLERSAPGSPDRRARI